MHERHTDRELYFREQAHTTSRYVIPFIESILPVKDSVSVLEIGCGEGGNLLPFLEAGCTMITGIDISETKIENARRFYSAIPGGDRIKFISADIYDSGSAGAFDIVMMRDVLEHIHDQEKFIGFVKRFLNPGGVLFVAFPPWNNPFGGHQQMCDSRLLSKMPWIHLLPRLLYRRLLLSAGESPARTEGLLEIKDTGINIGRFERAIKKKGFLIAKKSLWLINPNFEVKFGLKPRRLPQLFGEIPVLRNFIATTGYYIISAPRPGL
ncbi:MAG: class I SAM-dependent methyltransferase [Bacteroidales bacterium]